MSVPSRRANPHSGGWLAPRKAVVDTGAPVSLVPRYAWHSASFTPLASVRAAGVVNRPECTIPATLATLTCVLTSGADSSAPLVIHAMLADSDRVPFLLGMSGLLDSFPTAFNIPAGSAYVEAP